MNTRGIEQKLPLKNTDPGTLYGIGVGPGDPDLLTLRAIKTMARVDVILSAASPKNDYSRALSIALPHLPEGIACQRLDFPMTREPEKLQEAWKKNAQIIAGILESGKNAAFLTLGDPLIYSTFGYLMRTLQENSPHLPLEVVSGITSYQDAAAKSQTILCENGQNLLLVSGINDLENLQKSLEIADGAVILKAYRNFENICKAVTEKGRSKNTVFASQLGFPEENIVRGLENAPENPHYLSLLIVPPCE